MNNYTIAFQIAALIIGAAMLGNGILTYITNRKAIKLSMLELQLKTPIDPRIVELLDTFIEECFNDYIILNTEFIKDKYISEIEEQNIVSSLVDIVSSRISATMYKQLSVYYNEQAIPVIISNKIYQVVMNYVITTNAARETPEDK